MSAGPDVPAPALGPEERAAFARGVAEFNAGFFYECHDTLEDLWAGLRGPGRDFFQGLIQLAVGFYHLGNQNRTGARRLLSRALKRLEGYPDAYGGLDLAALRATVEEWQRELQGESLPEEASRRAPPRLRPAPGRRR